MYIYTGPDNVQFQFQTAVPSLSFGCPTSNNCGEEKERNFRGDTYCVANRERFDFRNVCKDESDSIRTAFEN